MSETTHPSDAGGVQPSGGEGETRRDFLYLATGAVGAAGAAVSSAGYLFRSTVFGQSAAAGSVDRLVTLTVNGQARRVDVLPQETLAQTLRYKLGLTGTKLGCDRAECGACTVLVDDVPHYACSVLTHTVRTKKIVTIEGLAKDDGTLHPVQQGVVEEQGFQCAFCMSGFIMSAVRACAMAVAGFHSISTQHVGSMRHPDARQRRSHNRTGCCEPCTFHSSPGPESHLGPRRKTKQLQAIAGQNAAASRRAGQQGDQCGCSDARNPKEVQRADHGAPHRNSGRFAKNLRRGCCDLA